VPFRRGSAIVMVLAFITVVSVVAAGVSYLSSGRRRVEALSMSDFRAFEAASSAVDYAARTLALEQVFPAAPYRDAPYFLQLIVNDDEAGLRGVCTGCSEWRALKDPDGKDAGKIWTAWTFPAAYRVTLRVDPVRELAKHDPGVVDMAPVIAPPAALPARPGGGTLAELGRDPLRERRHLPGPVREDHAHARSGPHVHGRRDHRRDRRAHHRREAPGERTGPPHGGAQVTRGAFSMMEILVVALLMGVFSFACWQLFGGGMRQLAGTADHQAALRNALLFTTALSQDLRAVAVLNERRDYQQPFPVSLYSLALSPNRTSLRMRMSAPLDALDADPASRFTIVTYQLVENPDRHGTYQVRRDERTASGANLPGTRSATRSHTFEDLTMGEVRYHFVAELGELEWRQFVMVRVKAVEGQAQSQTGVKAQQITRQFEVAIPPPPHGSAGGPKGFAADFPAGTLAGQLAGSQDIVARPGNLEALQPPSDAVDRRGQPVTLEPESPPSGLADPFARQEIATTPMRSVFLQAALDRLEAAVGAGYRGSLCGAALRLDASETAQKPLIVQLDAIFDKVRAKGPPAMLELMRNVQLEALPGVDKPPLEAAKLLCEERKVGP